jgi:alkylation response protein AidB-like acyl-CoA dehydrogenase
MSFNEYNEILNECRKFAKNEIRDQALEVDLTPDISWVKGIWSKSSQMDIPSLLIPESYGGAGYSELCCALVLDTIASECAGIASIFAHHFTACIPLIYSGAERSEKYIRRIAGEEEDRSVIASVIFPSDMEEKNVVLTQKHGRLFLSGTSQLTGNTDAAELLCIFAEDSENNKDITCIVLERDTHGISAGEDAKLPGLKVNPFKRITLEDVEIGREAVIGEQGNSLKMMKKTLAAFYGFTAAMAMGSARTAYRKAFAYAGERYQYGKMINQHQEIQRMLGSMLMKLGMGTSGYTRLYDEEKLNLPFSSTDPMMAKAFCTEAALEIILDAIQVHGGYGYMHEYGLEKIMRDVKVLQLLGGSNPYHHVRIIADMKQ